MTETQIGLEGSAVRQEQVSAPLSSLVESRFASRLFDRDAALWGADAAEEASIRLGWTDFHETAAALVPRIAALRDELRSEGVERIALCGMGGSSLAPAVIARWAGVDLAMLDSTHPDAVARALGGGLAHTAVVVSSKSGSTIETRSHLAAFERAFEAEGIDPATRIIIVTDPGSALERDSLEAGRRVFLADPDVGGRFSALTAFGLVPSGLAGADVRRLIDDAQSARALFTGDESSNPALLLAAAIAASLPERYVLATRSGRSADWGLASWIEQLVAESTGKNGVGVLPIALGADAAEFRSPPANTLRVRLTDAPGAAGSESAPAADDDLVVSGSLGAQLLLWEVATAALGHLMGIDPFNQPDVESAKVAARAALSAPPSDPDSSSTASAPAEVLGRLREGLVDNGYIAVQAYLDPHAPYAGRLSELRNRLAEAFGVPVALGWGPSYLHSTGQLHKGGPARGLYLQLLEDDPRHLAIPGAEQGFETLISAQARGDREVLTERGRPVFVLSSTNPAALVDAALQAL